jgi:hypothetical protein
MTWLFDLNKLKQGDILFSRSRNIGKAIAKATKGPYSHVMLYVGGTLIHAERNGVWSKNPQRITVEDPSLLNAFRLKNPLDENSLISLEDFARSKVGSLYSIPQAISTLRKPNSVIANEEQFCSRLVAQSFRAVNIELVDNPDFCTPNQIANSKMLEAVIGCVRKASIKNIEFSKTKDYNLEIQKETYIWLRKVRDLTKRRGLKPIHTQNDVNNLVIENPGLDKVIGNYVKSTKYSDYFDIDKKMNPWRYDSAKFIKNILATPFPLESLEIEKEINQSQIERYEKNLTGAEQNYQTGLSFFEIDLNLTNNILKYLYDWRLSIFNAENFLQSS